MAASLKNYAPRLTGDQIKAGDAIYGADQKGTLIYAISAVAVPSTKTANITRRRLLLFLMEISGKR
jgi:hypothetical protein